MIRRSVVVAAFAAVAFGAGSLALAAPASGPHGYNAAVNHVVNPSKKQGGTLKLLAGADCDSWDPARTYYGWCWNMQRLFTRTLIGYQQVNGHHATLDPDLATGMGRHNKANTRWSYTLKKGLKFSTGKPIRPTDVKYGIERLFATNVINGGPSSYFINTIKHPVAYAGPYRDGGLRSIHTTKRTITFHLSSPYADFDYLMALPAAAPVPYKVEGGPRHKGARYQLHPVSSGPFMIKSYEPDNRIVFVRNPYWKQRTDSIRHPHAGEVTLSVDANPDDIDHRLQAGTADARADGGVAATLQARILTNPDLKKHADDPSGSLLRYLAVMKSTIPNIHCRRAIFYALDKQSAVRAFGGATAGSVAHSMTPPGIPGYQPQYDPYPSGRDDTGNVAKAKAELRACGKPHGFSTKFAYETPGSDSENLFELERTALGRVGIKIRAVTADAATYYDTFIGSPQTILNKHIGIAVAGWGPDFPTGLGFFDLIVDGRNITPTGNWNYASLNDPTVNAVLAQARRHTVSTAKWETLDHRVMKHAVYLPLVDGRTLYYRNPDMTNVTCDNAIAFGAYDFVNIGIKKR